MLIEQPPRLYRMLFPGALWRRRLEGRKVVYLTFDDGPIPEVTPWVLDTLARYNIHATFFMVGDNAKKHPGILRRIKEEGHSYGNHTMHHLPGLTTGYRRFRDDIREANRIIGSRLFRPPHGLMRWSQAWMVEQNYTLVMYDVITRDYDYSLKPENIINNVKRYTRDGSIIVFHDSLKSWCNLRNALPACIEWLRQQGYEFLPLPMV